MDSAELGKGPVVGSSEHDKSLPVLQKFLDQVSDFLTSLSARQED
jgi:hypothetical protein